MHLATSMPKTTEVSAFMAKRIAAKDVFGTKISTNSTCYQTMWCQWLLSISLTLPKSRVALCLCYGGTSLNSPAPLHLQVQFYEYILYLSYSLHLLGERGKKKRQKKADVLLFFSVPRLREDLRWIPFWRYGTLLTKENILKKQLNKGSLKHTFSWNTWSYDKTYKTIQPSPI